jgi:hypothetical protein
VAAWGVPQQPRGTAGGAGGRREENKPAGHERRTRRKKIGGRGSHDLLLHDQSHIRVSPPKYASDIFAPFDALQMNN